MSQPTLHLEFRGAVTLVTLDRPPANAMSHGLLRALLGVLPTLRQAQAVVVTGAGRFFSAGLDLDEVVSLGEEDGRAFATVFDDVLTGLFALEIPVVAAVNGHAMAGGAVLAATADFRLIAEGTARVGLPEIQVGVPFPTSALEIVRTSCGGPHLYTVLQRGLGYLPAEALTRNLVDEIVPSTEVLPRAIALAEELASRPHVAFASTKRALRAESLGRIHAAQAAGLDPIWEQWRSPEVLASIAAYRERVLRR